MRCVVVGAGGHAAVVIDAMLAAGIIPEGILDRTDARRGERVLGVPILGDDSLIMELRDRGFEAFVVGVGSFGVAPARQRLFDSLLATGLAPLAVRHPSAIVSLSAALGEGAQLLAGCVVNPRAEIGRNCIINTCSVIEHDCRIGDHVHVAPGVVLAGAVTVGDGAHIGLGASVREGVHVGARAIVGAGAAVISDVGADTTVVGVPARVRRRGAAPAVPAPGLDG